MRSKVTDTLPAKMKRALRQLGGNIVTARKRRRLTIAMMVERVGVAKSTYLRAEKGDPAVSLAVYAMVLFVLGGGEELGKLLDPAKDEQGLQLDTEHLPKRVRRKKSKGVL